mgnify:CR=1 FL=1
MYNTTKTEYQVGGGGWHLVGAAATALHDNGGVARMFILANTSFWYRYTAKANRLGSGRYKAGMALRARSGDNTVHENDRQHGDRHQDNWRCRAPEAPRFLWLERNALRRWHEGCWHVPVVAVTAAGRWCRVVYVHLLSLDGSSHRLVHRERDRDRFLRRASSSSSSCQRGIDHSFSSFASFSSRSFVRVAIMPPYLL